MRKLLSLLPLVALALIPVFSSAQAVDTVYNWNNTRFSADVTQAKRVCLGRVYYNTIHWGVYSSIKFTLRQDYFTSGIVEYQLTIRQGAPQLYCTGAAGVHIDKGRLVLGEPVATNTTFLSEPNYYRNIYLDVDFYTAWQVSANVTGNYFAMDKFSLTDGNDFHYSTLFSSPVIENIASFFPDIKNIILADNGVNSSRFGIGQPNPQAPLHIYKATTGDYNPTLVLDGPINSERSIAFNDEGQLAWWFGRDNNPASNLYNGIGFWHPTAGIGLVIKDDGRMVLGNGDPKAGVKLTVDGAIHATKVKVEQNVWADHVFEAGYSLPSLSALESFIRQNKHLPDIPTAKEVAANGIDLGEMNRKLLQKIEELTLHLIDQDKRLEALEKENEEMKKEKATTGR